MSPRLVPPLALLLLSACASTDRRGAALDDADAPARDRRAAIELAGRRAADAESDPETRAASRERLKQVAWKRSDAAPARIAAIDALAADAACDADTAAMLNLLLPTESNWAVIGHACDLIARRAWIAAAPGLVRSWARPVETPADPDRPERAALLALFPGRDAESIVFDVFAAPATDQFGERARMDAWALLCRIDTTGERTRDLLARTPANTPDPLLADLAAGAAELRAFPRTTEQLEWLRELRKPEHAAFWTAARSLIASLAGEQAEGFELRHAAGLLWARERAPELLSATRDDLLQRIESALAGRRTRLRTADVPVTAAAVKEDLATWRRELVWGDALLILAAIDGLADPAVVAALFEQADGDLLDSSTEHGGVLTLRDGAFHALHFPPRASQRLGDRRFVASPDLLTAGAAALFHYHFHAQTHANTEYAGPGFGDLDYARTFGRSCLVFTFTGKNTLGADYYQPDGARIDLGEVARP